MLLATCSSVDTTPTPVVSGTLGEEIVRVVCERLASEADPTDVTGLAWKPVCRGEEPPPDDAPPRLRALMRNRARLVRALDAALPESMKPDLEHLLRQLLPLYDPPRERLPSSTRLLADLVHRLASDREALEALERLGGREGYRPLRLALGVARPVMAYPELEGFTDQALRVLTDLPEDSSDGLAVEPWREVQRALALELAAMQPAPPRPAGDRSTLAAARELLFLDDADFGAVGLPRWILTRDTRGVAVPANGGVVSPFVDMDSDGLPDIDPSGRFVDATGTPLVLPAPFRVRDEPAGTLRDLDGLALREDGTRVYAYRNADRTLLAGMMREVRPWFSPETPTGLELARGLPAILGPDSAIERSYGSATLRYTGPRTSAGSLFDLVYALGELLSHEETDRALALTQQLLSEHEPDVAPLIDTALAWDERADHFPEAVMRQPNVFWDDLIDLGVHFAHKPGMLEALLRALADSRSARLGDVYAAMMRNRDFVDVDPSDVNGPPIGLPLDQPVDRSRPDLLGNESLFERSQALIDGLDGVQLCNKEGAVLRVHLRGLDVRWPLLRSYHRCELIQIDNVDQAYSEALLGRYELVLKDDTLDGLLSRVGSIGIIDVDQLLEESSGIRGLTRHPTPQAFDRMVFWGLGRQADGSPNSEFFDALFEPMVDRHGNDVIDTYAGTIYAWEMPGFFEGMTPLLEVLHDPRYVTDDVGRYSFGELIGTVWRHWPSRGHWYTQATDPLGPNFSHQDDGRSYEELVAGYIEGQFFPRLGTLLRTLDETEIEPGRDGLRVLAEATEALLDPERNPGLATRDGRTRLRTNDGSREVAVTPLLVLLDALSAMDRDFGRPEAAERLGAWRSARGRIVDQLASVSDGGGVQRLADRRARALLLGTTGYVRTLVAEHRERGDLVAWAHGLTPRLEDTMSSPLLSALVRLLDRVQADPAARDALSHLLGYLVDETSSNDAFASTLDAVADALVMFEDDRNIVPLAHALSQAVAPDSLDVVGGRAGEPEVDGSVTSDSVRLLREIRAVDDRDTLPSILSNLVQLPSSGDEITPLEEILDVISEVNRSSPGSGGSYTAADYEVMLGQANEFLSDERRGLERLFAVVQQREIP